MIHLCRTTKVNSEQKGSVTKKHVDQPLNGLEAEATGTLERPTGMACLTPINRSVLSTPVSTLTDLDRTSIDRTCGEYGLGYFSHNPIVVVDHEWLRKIVVTSGESVDELTMEVLGRGGSQYSLVRKLLLEKPDHDLTGFSAVARAEM